MTDTTQTTETQTGADGASQTGTSAQTDAGADTGAKGGKASKAADAGQGTGDTGAQGGEKPFYEAFSDAKLKESPVVLRHKTTEDLARSLVAAESRLGVPADQLIRLPSKPEEFADVYRKLGAPESPEGYKVELPEQATEADKALAQRFTKTMFDQGPFPPAMVKAAVDFINGETLAADEALATAEASRKAEGEALLKKELGAAYDPDFKAVGKMLADSGIEGLADELDLTGQGDNPKLLLFLHKVMEGRSESQSIEGNNSGTGAAGAPTPGQAKAARLNLENDPTKGAALRDASHPMHKSVLEERRKLLALENGQAA